MKLVCVALALLAAGLGASVIDRASAQPACDRQKVMQIDSAKVDMIDVGTFTIFVFGTSESAGWKNPTLVPAGAPVDGVATVDFVACRPEVSAQVLTPIQVQQKLDLGGATWRVVIRARTNSMTIDMKQR